MFPELHRSLSNAVATGKIGTPVSVRVHLQLPECAANFDAAIDSIVEMVEPAVPQPLGTLQSRVHSDGNQWNLLMRSANGHSLFITLGRGSVTEPSLELLVVGNHGVIRLDGGDVVSEAVDCATKASESQPPAERWTQLVQQSHDDGSVVSLNQ